MLCRGVTDRRYVNRDSPLCYTPGPHDQPAQRRGAHGLKHIHPRRDKRSRSPSMPPRTTPERSGDLRGGRATTGRRLGGSPGPPSSTSRPARSPASRRPQEVSCCLHESHPTPHPDHRGVDARAHDGGADVAEEPSPGAGAPELTAEEVADRRRRRSLATVVVVSGGVTWTFLVGTVCMVTVHLAIVDPGRLQGFVVIAYPSVGGATVVVAVLERVVTCLGPRARRRRPRHSEPR